MAGRLGCGGGLLFSDPLLQAAGLKDGAGNHCHQRVGAGPAMIVPATTSGSKQALPHLDDGADQPSHRL
jgi:hypothetical protein